jgi:hypothetical protein
MNHGPICQHSPKVPSAVRILGSKRASVISAHAQEQHGLHIVISVRERPHRRPLPRATRLSGLHAHSSLPPAIRGVTLAAWSARLNGAERGCACELATRQQTTLQRPPSPASSVTDERMPARDVAQSRYNIRALRRDWNRLGRAPGLSLPIPAHLCSHWLSCKKLPDASLRVHPHPRCPCPIVNAE